MSGFGSPWSDPRMAVHEGVYVNPGLGSPEVPDLSDLGPKRAIWPETGDLAQNRAISARIGEIREIEPSDSEIAEIRAKKLEKRANSVKSELKKTFSGGSKKGSGFGLGFGKSGSQKGRLIPLSIGF